MPEKVAGNLRLENVSFCYPSRPQVKALDNINLSVEQPEETPEELINEGGNKFTMDIGAILSPIKGLNLAVVYSNAVPMDDDHYPRLLGLGISYALGARFLAEFDVGWTSIEARR